jgi:hypothetical protein
MELKPFENLYIYIWSDKTVQNLNEMKKEEL